MAQYFFEKHRNLFFLCSIFLFLLLYSRSTSPLYYVMGEDSCIFMIIGRELLNGKVPYVDLYENKGPFLYFIQALPLLIWNSRYSVLLLQLILWFIEFKIIDTVSVYLFKKKSSLAVYVVFFLFALFNLEEGNLAEEYNLFFIMISLYCFIQILEKDRHILPGILMGASFAAVALIRINDIVPICVLILCAFVHLWSKQKAFTYNLRYLLSVLSGIALIVGPTLWFYHTKASINDMIHGYLLVNSQYVDGENSSFVLDRLRLFLTPFGILCLVVFVCAVVSAYILHQQKERPYAFRLAMWLLPCLTIPALFVSKSGYMHYTFILEIIVALSILTLWNTVMPDWYEYLQKRFHISRLVIHISAVILICFLNYISCHGITAPLTANNRLVPWESDYINSINALMEQIPTDEQDSLYVINGFSTNFYMQTNLLPPYRYFLPIVYAEISPDIDTELINYFHNDAPQWIIVSDWSKIQQASTGIYEFLYNNYTLVPTEASHAKLYHLN